MFWRATPKVYVIVALSRPQQLPFVYFQFQRFTYQNKALVIVECGKGKGACQEQGMIPCLLLQHDGNAGQCRNKALDALSKEKGHWIAMDDDDFYGQDYIQEHIKLTEKNRRPLAIGKYEYVVMNDCMVKFKESPMTLLGASLGGTLPCEQRYADKPIGEEKGMISDLTKVEKGSLPIAVSRLGQAESHTWKATDDRLWSLHKQGWLCQGGTVYDYIEKRREPKTDTIVPSNRVLKCKEASPIELGLPSYIPYSI